MNIDEIERLIRDSVVDYIEEEESYDDNAQLRIDPAKMTISVVSGAEAEDNDTSAGDNSEIDYIDIMELIKMNPSDPGKWLPDDDAIKCLAEEYANV